eukprot:6178539-Pleurochrysis_carterae.AAC.1
MVETRAGLESTWRRWSSVAATCDSSDSPRREKGLPKSAGESGTCVLGRPTYTSWTPSCTCVVRRVVRWRSEAQTLGTSGGKQPPAPRTIAETAGRARGDGGVEGGSREKGGGDDWVGDRGRGGGVGGDGGACERWTRSWSDGGGCGGEVGGDGGASVRSMRAWVASHADGANVEGPGMKL